MQNQADFLSKMRTVDNRPYRMISSRGRLRSFSSKWAGMETRPYIPEIIFIKNSFFRRIVRAGTQARPYRTLWYVAGRPGVRPPNSPPWRGGRQSRTGWSKGDIAAATEGILAQFAGRCGHRPLQILHNQICALGRTFIVNCTLYIVNYPGVHPLQHSAQSGAPGIIPGTLR